ncbi:MAG: TonB-dependent receptor [Alistipes sp.]|nr:TonB-dependent receptor [Alistipes sp.]
MKNLILTLLATLLATLGLAQNTPSIKGKVIDSSTQKAIEFADVVITDQENNTIASTTVKAGEFSLQRVKDGEFYLSILLVGYQPYVSEKLTFKQGKTIDLGTISLAMVETGLKEVVVSGEKSRVVYKLDRQKISGNSSLLASGGTAVDILKSTPSIRVDADGGISFRGSSGFLVFVNNKPSPLEGTQALEQIAAANIEDIEIITTPSARYRTDGDVGIINIITKSQSDEGFQGSINLSGSTIGTWNSDILLGHKKGSNRFYMGLATSEIKRKSDFDQTKTTIVDDYKTTSISDGERFGAVASYLGRLGWEFNKKGHTLLIELQGGMAKNSSGGNMSYDEHRTKGEVLINDNLYNSRDRYSNEKHIAQIMTDYSWKINERGDRLSINGRLRYDPYALEYTESNMFEQSGTRYEGTRGYEKEHHWDFDGGANYELNYSSTGKAELGYQYTSYSEHGGYNIKYWDREMMDFDWQEDLHAPFFYRRQIHSAYLMLSDKFGPLSFDAGVRADRTIDELTITVKDADRHIKRLELFPSTHLSYEAPGKNFFSLGYSYRINRPGIWKLEPYITYEDYYTKKIGNPDIKPEYIHSAELGYRKVIAEENTIAVTGFYRHRRGVTDNVRVAHEPGVTLDSLVNAGNDRTLGVEAMINIKNTRWWRMTINGSLFDYKFTSRYEGSTDNANVSYTASMINNFTLGNTTQMQFDANVVGPTVLSQGREEAYCYFDLALRQILVKNKLSASLVVHDILRTAKYDNYRRSKTLQSMTYIKPRYPNIMLSLSYTFNSKQKQHSGKVSTGAMFEGKDF